MKPFFKKLPSLMKETFQEWQNDNAMRLAAALAYYTVFSLAPLMLASISVAGLVFGDQAATGKIYAELQSVAGPQVASSVQEMVQAADKPAVGFWGAVLGFLMGLFGASGVFGELMGSLNQIWGVKAEEEGGIWLWIKGRFLSIGMVMGVCFLLLVSMIANAFLTTVTSYGLSWMPGVNFLGQAVSFVVSFAFVTALFAAMFKFLPKTPIQWRDVWTGGAVTALLFTLGKFALEQYLARSNPASGYGAAGALALILVWVYYSAQIFFFGAEFTEVYARRLGSRSSHPAPSDVRDGTAAPMDPVLEEMEAAGLSTGGKTKTWKSKAALAEEGYASSAPSPAGKTPKSLTPETAGRPSALGQFAALAVAGWLTYRAEKKAARRITWH
ncbi:MAG: YihY/virulence factor BrkB family protein [Verrucomicrobiota bacterium]